MVQSQDKVDGGQAASPQEQGRARLCVGYNAGRVAKVRIVTNDLWVIGLLPAAFSIRSLPFLLLQRDQAQHFYIDEGDLHSIIHLSHLA